MPTGSQMQRVLPSTSTKRRPEEISPNGIDPGTIDEKLMTKNMQGIAVFTGVGIVGLAFALWSGDLDLSGWSSTSPQRMCSSRGVEDTLRKLWVDTLSGASFTSVLGIPDDKKNQGPRSEITFVSEPMAVQYDRDIHRVICQRGFTTTNDLVNLTMLRTGKTELTTSYSVQPGSSGGYIVSILDAPQD